MYLYSPFSTLLAQADIGKLLYLNEITAKYINQPNFDSKRTASPMWQDDKLGLPRYSPL